MVTNKSLDPFINRIIVALVDDVHTSHSEVFTQKAARLTSEKMLERLSSEGVGFLTKALPRLAKCLDQALACNCTFDATKYGFETIPNSKLPKLFGELFERVFAHDGTVLLTPCVRSIKTLRQVLYLFYKYELPYSHDEEQKVIDSFIKTESELSSVNEHFEKVSQGAGNDLIDYQALEPGIRQIVRGARRSLFDLFKFFNVKDIYPRHGPGAVSNGERLWDKYDWKNIPDRIASTYPIDEYYYASLGHVCDAQAEIISLGNNESSAKVILVPKDSRGPRLISCESKEFQWIQQGLGRALMEHVETHYTTRYNVFFTNQQPNQFAALYGSSTGLYSTLDLKEASDRVSVGLVKLLFPEPLLSALLNCRSLTTRLPDKSILKLNKFAPMGSALCFPVLALTVWAILNAGAPDAYTRERIYVYGDDVIVPTAQAANAIMQLESFGLLVNRDKSCTSGFFRESCGMDAYKGVAVTPVRFRTVWTRHRSPDAYVSWIAYANSLYSRKYFNVYDVIVEELVRKYGKIPEMSQDLSCPSLIEVPEPYRPKQTRVHTDYQIRQYRVWDVKSRVIKKEIDGWRMLLRYFAEAHAKTNLLNAVHRGRSHQIGAHNTERPFRVTSYTKRRTIKLVRCWR